MLLASVITEHHGAGQTLTASPTATSLGTTETDHAPTPYADLIRAAAASCDEGLPPSILAAQIWAESRFDPTAVSRDSFGNPIARGISQFIPDTWANQSLDGDGDGDKDVWDPKDAIPSQGRMMCSLLKTAKSRPWYNGSAIELALAGYNAGWGRVEQYEGVPPVWFAHGQTHHYVRAIMGRTAKYTAELDASYTPSDPMADPELADAPAAVRTAVTWALAQKGGWYQYGGDCSDPLGNHPAHRCDSSSLVQQAYNTAGITIPRVTYDQIDLPHQVDLDHPKPGDLVFSPGSDGTLANPGHVAMYVGSGLLIEAPHTGTRTRLIPYNSRRHSTNVRTRITAVRRVVPW
ncbi:bifunctional lytic transglycosylase/C40 family peptidase [Streptomyces vinaceus]